MDIDLLKRLNPVQKDAVTHGDGPVLVLAGAGSGKTRVLTYRIAYLIKTKEVSPSHILAMTFTNKAAKEMKERVEALIGKSINNLWIGTFHSICSRILRNEIGKLGYTSQFTIYDVSDQEKIIKKIMEARGISGKNISPRQIQHRISSLKNKGISPAVFESTHKSFNDPLTSAVKTVYPEYEIRMRRNNALDFDDLLLKTLEIFEEFPDILQKYQERFRYILIDEYQDTNYIQYQIITRLAKKYRNIFVVGDDDQSIYKWRGAEVKNIFRLVDDFPDIQKFRLEQNYRSSPEILEVANAVISQNTARMDKKLWTEIPPMNEKPVIIETENARHEAEKVYDTIMELRASYGYDYKDFAILYRTNAQSRYFEELFVRRNVPYLIFGGMKFYERKEIKDILAYLKFLVNPSDLVSMERIINVPSRKIGEATLRALYDFSSKKGIEVSNVLLNFNKYRSEFRNASGLAEFSGIFNRLREALAEMKPLEFFDYMLKETGIYEYYEKESTYEGVDRTENIDQLRVSVHEFFDTYGREASGIADYLQHVSLLTDVDNPQGQDTGVKLMTIHAAKGLEFPVVFVVGLEDKLFPHSLSMDHQEDFEEERRLFYVAATRSQERLFLTYALYRDMYGNGYGEKRKKSVFLEEIPPELVNVKSFAHSTSYSDYGRGNNSVSIGNGSKYNVGDWVIHATYGRGQVVGVEGRGTRERIVVVFEDNQMKTLFTHIAPIEKE